MDDEQLIRLRSDLGRVKEYLLINNTFTLIGMIILFFGSFAVMYEMFQDLNGHMIPIIGAVIAVATLIIRFPLIYKQEELEQLLADKTVVSMEVEQ